MTNIFLFIRHLCSPKRLTRNVKNCLLFFCLFSIITLVFIYTKVDHIPSKNSFDSSAHEGDSVVAPFGRRSKEEINKAKSKYSHEGKVDIDMQDMYSRLEYLDLDGGVWKQGWPYSAVLPKGEPLKVIVTPHSHQDPGWIWTFEEYFTKKTQNSLDSTVAFLMKNPEAKFIYAEISFLSLWWKEASKSQREDLKTLISYGQFEIVTGGWVMNDEANTHHFAMIDQLTEGHQWLMETFNYSPRSGWQIDPFGHSTTMGFLAKKANLSQILIQRTHYEIKKELARNKQLEFNWLQPWEKKGDSSIFCHMMPFYSYDIPHTCGPDPSVCCQFDYLRTRIGCPWGILPESVTESNVKEKSEMLINQYHLKAMLYNNNNVLFVPLGDDFRYLSLDEWEGQFTNYKKIMAYINANKELYNTEIAFGTLSDYFDALRSRNDIKDFPSLQGDMFTYADRVKDYWSGYYTSRPLHKRLTRRVESQLRSADILYSLGHLESVKGRLSREELFDQLTLARRNLGLFQHHDGVTGTAKPHVVIDYQNKLEAAINSAIHVQEEAIKLIFNLSSSAKIKSLDSTWREEMPALSVTNMSQTHKLLIFNSNLVWHNQVLRFKVDLAQRELVAGHEPSMTLYDDPNNEIDLHFERVDSSFEITFRPDYPLINGLSFKVINLNFVKAAKKHVEITSKISDIENDKIRLEFNAETGLLERIFDKETSTQMSVNINFKYYSAKKSGAYLFMPDNEEASIYKMVDPKIEVKQGAVHSEVIISDHLVTHRVILAKKSDAARSFEVTNTVNLIDRDESIELVMAISTQIENNKDLFTDSNCYQVIERRYIHKIPLQGNVYPMPCSAFIQGLTEDQKAYERLTIVTGHPVGAVSPKNGEIQLWLDRKSLTDDNRGLQTGVMDNQVVTNRFLLSFENIPVELVRDDSIPKHTEFAVRMLQNLLRPMHLYSIVCPDSTNEEGFCIEKDHEMLKSKAVKFNTEFTLVNLKTFHSTSNVFAGFNSLAKSQIGFVIKRIPHLLNDSSKSKTSLKLVDTNLKLISGVASFHEATVTLLPNSTSSLFQLSDNLDDLIDQFDIKGYLFKFK